MGSRGDLPHQVGEGVLRDDLRGVPRHALVGERLLAPAGLAGHPIQAYPKVPGLVFVQTRATGGLSPGR